MAFVRDTASPPKNRRRTTRGCPGCTKRIARRCSASSTRSWSKGKDAWDNTFRIVLPDGKVSWIQSLGRADRAADGQVTRLTGLDLDVTERRRAEEALQARRDEERDRELQLLLETATQGIVSVDAQATIVTANRALEAMFGWAPGELIGQSIERLVPPSVRDAHVQHRTGYFAAPGPRPMGVNSSSSVNGKTGRRFRSKSA